MKRKVIMRLLPALLCASMLGTPAAVSAATMYDDTPVINLLDTETATEISIDEAHFPDPAFREYVRTELAEGSDTISSDFNGMIDLSDNENITSLQGAELLKHVRSISMDHVPNVKELTLTDMPYLESVSVYDSPVSKVTITGCPQVKTLVLSETELASTDDIVMSDDERLNILAIWPAENSQTFTYADFSKLYFSDLKELEAKSFCGTQFDISPLTKLERFNYSGDTALNTVNLYEHPGLTSLGLKSDTLETLDLSAFPMLQYVTLDLPMVQHLDFSGIPNLLIARLNRVPQKTLDFSANPRLYVCYVTNSQTQYVNFKGCALEELYLGAWEEQNNITRIDADVDMSAMRRLHEYSVPMDYHTTDDPEYPYAFDLSDFSDEEIARLSARDTTSRIDAEKKLVYFNDLKGAPVQYMTGLDGSYLQYTIVPKNSGTGKATNPDDHPTAPDITDPTNPDITKPTNPDVTDPTNPDVTQPDKPDTTHPDITNPTVPDNSGKDQPDIGKTTDSGKKETKPDTKTNGKSDSQKQKSGSEQKQSSNSGHSGEATVNNGGTEKKKVDTHVTLYELYNPATKDYFYTKSEKEYKALVKAGWKADGKLCKVPYKSKIPVYRMLNTDGSHHFTMDKAEKEALEKGGWKCEGIGWYSVEKKANPVWRMYNPTDHSHRFVKTNKEKDDLLKKGWTSEGTGFYT